MTFTMSDCLTDVPYVTINSSPTKLPVTREQKLTSVCAEIRVTEITPLTDRKLDSSHLICYRKEKLEYQDTSVETDGSPTVPRCWRRVSQWPTSP